MPVMKTIKVSAQDVQAQVDLYLGAKATLEDNKATMEEAFPELVIQNTQAESVKEKARKALLTFWEEGGKKPLQLKGGKTLDVAESFIPAMTRRTVKIEDTKKAVPSLPAYQTKKG